MRPSTSILELVDAHAGAIATADAIFVFGTQHWSPAELAAELYLNGLAPVVITTGGAARHPRGLAEGEQHRDLLIASGVPAEDVMVEGSSNNTLENVTNSLSLLASLGEVRSVLAVVKWFHRRALITLAEQAPSLERIYAADYEPFNHHTRAGLSRATWETSCPKSVSKEVQYLQEMEANGIDLLQRTDQGWIRTPRGH